MDGSGNAFVTEYSSHIIRKLVVATGQVTLFAGLPGSAGSVNGAGTTARFNTPSGITFDGSGSLYISDYGSAYIRKLDIASASASFFVGDGTSGAVDGVGTLARVFRPYGIVCDGVGVLYVVENGGHRVRRVAIASATVTTLAGSTRGYADGTGTAALFNSPAGVFLSGGSLFVVDNSNARIRQIVIATGVVTTVAGGATTGSNDGVGTNARFREPTGIVGDGAGNLFVTDSYNDRIRQISLSSGVVATLVGSTTGTADGPFSGAQFSFPTDLFLFNGKLYVTDTSNNRIRVVPVA